MINVTKKFSLIILLLIILFLIPLFLTGCWNNKDLTNLGIVVGVGLDKISTDEIEITVQMLKPNIMESQKQGSSAKGTNTISARGRTIFEANRNLLNKTNKKLFYSHIQLTVIGEELARNGIEDILDLFQRVCEIDKREVVLISKGIPVKELFNIETVHSSALSTEIVETIKNTSKLPSIRKVTLNELVLASLNPEKNTIVGIVKGAENGNNSNVSSLNFTGSAVLKNNKLVGWLNPMETFAYSFIDNKFENGALIIENPVTPSEYLTIEIFNSTSKTDVIFKNNKPILYVEVRAEGRLVEQHGKGNLTSSDKIMDLQTEVEEYIKNIIGGVIMCAQENYQTDFLGFGNIIHKKNLNYWNEVEKNWDNIFCDLPVEVKVKYKNENFGLIKEHK